MSPARERTRPDDQEKDIKNADAEYQWRMRISVCTVDSGFAYRVQRYILGKPKSSMPQKIRRTYDTGQIL
jgi:hypothetical protein